MSVNYGAAELIQFQACRAETRGDRRRPEETLLCQGLKYGRCSENAAQRLCLCLRFIPLPSSSSFGPIRDKSYDQIYQMSNQIFFLAKSRFEKLLCEGKTPEKDVQQRQPCQRQAC